MTLFFFSPVARPLPPVACRLSPVA